MILYYCIVVQTLRKWKPFIDSLPQHEISNLRFRKETVKEALRVRLRFFTTSFPIVLGWSLSIEHGSA